MLLNQIKNSISRQHNYYSGLTWFSMVYYIINISIHNIVSTNPVNHNIDMVTCVKKHFINILPLCSISQKNRISGLVRCTTTNTLNHTKPTMSHDNESRWFTNLDCIKGVWFCH